MRFIRRSGLPEQGADDSGFTLIELLVVVLIIGVLLGIAVPTYLSVTSGAKTNAAESNLQSALTGMKSVYSTTESGAYAATATLTSDLQGAGTSLTYGTSATSSPGTILVDDVNTATAMLINSDGTNCYAVADVESVPSGGLTLLGTTIPDSGTYWAKWAQPSGGCIVPSTASFSTSLPTASS